MLTASQLASLSQEFQARQGVLFSMVRAGDGNGLGPEAIWRQFYELLAGEMAQGLEEDRQRRALVRLEEAWDEGTVS